MARIDVAMPSDNSEVSITPMFGDTVVMSFNSGPNPGPGLIQIGSSGGVGLSGQLYADSALTQPLGPRSGSVGSVAAHFGIAEAYLMYPQVALNTDLWFAVDINSADVHGVPLGTSANLHLPSAQKPGGPHHRHQRS